MTARALGAGAGGVTGWAAYRALTPAANAPRATVPATNKRRRLMASRKFTPTLYALQRS